MDPALLQILTDHLDAMLALRQSLLAAADAAGENRMGYELAASSLDVELARFSDVVLPAILNQPPPRPRPALQVVR